MKHVLESVVNKITTYRLVMFGLLPIALLSLLLSSTGQLGLPFESLLLSYILIVTSSYVFSRLFAWTFSTSHNSESWMITGLILFLVLPPASTPKSVLVCIAAAFIATASKYFLAYKQRHIFNPAAITLLILGGSGLSGALWWIGTPLLLPAVSIVGLLIVTKTRRYAMVGTFLAVAIITSLVVSLLQQYSIEETLKTAIVSGPIIFFASVMLTEPLTSPTTRKWQLVFAVIVGIWYGGNFFTGDFAWLSTPAAALIIGNLFAFAVGTKKAIRLKIDDVQEIGPNIHEVVTTPLVPFSFSPGQYLELSLPHKKQDQKGMRRIFSIASAPGESTVRFGITHGNTMSSFKKALLESKGKTIRTTLLGGDFLLPDDPQTPLLFMAGGIGITPFRSMLADLSLRAEKRDIVLFYGANTIDSIVFQDVLDQAEKTSGLTVIPILASPPEGWRGETGFVRTTLLARYAPDFRERTIFISGPPVMVDTLKKDLKHMGVSRKQIITDHFSGY